MYKTNKIENYCSMIEDVPELEGMEDLVCQVLGMDIFDEDPVFPYAETKKNPKMFKKSPKTFKNQEKAKNTLINVLLDTTRQMNQKIARLCAALLDRDPNSPIGLKYQTGRKALLKEKRTDVDLKVDKNTEAIVDQSISKDLESQKNVLDGQVQGGTKWMNCRMTIYVMYP
jgi:hypothetical protein